MTCEALQNMLKSDFQGLMGQRGRVGKCAEGGKITAAQGRLISLYKLIS